MWYVSQIGRREHYALPAYLHRVGLLGLFATDIWAPWAANPRSLIRSKKLAQRFEASLRDAPVVSLSWLANLTGRMGGGDVFRRWTREGAAFGEFAAREFRRSGLKSGDRVIGYTAANLEQLVFAKETGAKALHVQVDPAMSWYEIRRLEQQDFTAAEGPSPMPSPEFLDRIRSEWGQADKVIVHSAHSREALLAQGVDPGRCVVIPPAFAAPSQAPARRLNPGRKLRVLFVGNHCLAKGYHTFVEAARRAGAAFEFVSVGTTTMRPDFLAEASRHVRILGSKTQAEVRSEMAQSDVFVFPTLSDGFGLVQLEAMAAGLPVIATPCCGDVVRHGLDGFVVPPRDAVSIVEALEGLRADPDRYERLSAAASRRPSDYGPERHFGALLAL